MKLKWGSVIILLLVSALVQGQVRFSLYAGPQVNSVNYSVRGREQDADPKPGLMAGLGLKAHFEGRLYFHPSVYYSLKGYRVTLADSAFPPTQLALNNNVTIHTIELAPLFQVDLSSKPSHAFLRFGPSVDIAFAGTEEFDTLSSAGVIGTLKRPMNFDFIAYGRFTASAHIHLGYESRRGWMVFAHYAHGIGNRNNGDFGPRILHRVLGISAGWYFARAGD
jgi:hypothetical protein